MGGGGGGGASSGKREKEEPWDRSMRKKASLLAPASAIAPDREKMIKPERDETKERQQECGKIER